MVQLFRMQIEQNKLSSDCQSVKNAFLENRSRFSWPRDDKEATEILNHFFSDSSFVTRLQQHQAHVNKSKHKAKSILTLYYVELSDANKLLNMLAYGDKGSQILAKFYKDVQDKKPKEVIP